MIRVLDLERSMRFCGDVLGLRKSHRLDIPDFSLVYLRDAESDVEIELTCNGGRPIRKRTVMAMATWRWS